MSVATMPLVRRIGRVAARLNGPLVIGALFVLAILVAAVGAPLVAPFDPYDPQVRFDEGRMVAMPYPPGRFGMLLGSDAVGRDIFSRLLYGSRFTLLFCGVAALVRVLIGACLGMIAAWYRRAGRAIDILVTAWSAVPSLIFAIVPVAIVNLRGNPAASTIVFIVVLSLTGWAEAAVRTKLAVAQIRGRLYVEAAYATGLSRAAVLWRHVLPNVRDLLVVEAAYAMGAALLLVAELAFLNVFVGAAEHDDLGTSPTPIPILAEWGGMLARGLRERSLGIWMLLAPLACFTLAILAFNLLAEGMRRRR
jgi:peptide/nickel transport system permease protein